MKKQMIIAFLIILVIVGGTAYVGYRFFNRGRDIIGVTTLTNENIVIMNSANGKEFVSGEGEITVHDGEHIHLEYKLKEGSFDLTVNLEGTPFEQKEIEGSGSLDVEAEPGSYKVTFTMHGAIGNAKMTAVK